MMNVYSFHKPIDNQEDENQNQNSKITINNISKLAINNNQEPSSYLNLTHNPSQSSNCPQSLSNDQYTQSMDLNMISQLQSNQNQKALKTTKKIRKTNPKKQNDPKMFLPKTLQSENKGQEESISVNSCLQTIEQMDHQQQYQFIQPMTFQYFPQPSVSGMPLPKLQQDIQPANSQQQSPQMTDVSEGNQKVVKQQSTKKPKKENVNTGHWTQDEHNTYIQFLSQYEEIMTSSSMKKTSKIFKQMSELIGSRTPSQCRSHHQKFNPYALRGENGKRLPRNERSRAGRKRKNQIQEKDLPLLNSEYLIEEIQQFEELDRGYYQNELMFGQEICVMPQQVNVEWQEQVMFQDQQMYQPMVGSELEIYQYFENLKAEELQKKQDDQKMVDMYEAFFKSPGMGGRKGSEGNVIPMAELGARQQEQQI